MNLSLPLTVADRFAWIILALRRSVAECWRPRSVLGRVHCAIPPALIALICGRLNRVAARFAVVAAGIADGTFRARPRRAPRPAPSRAEMPAREASRPARLRMPGRFGWLLQAEPDCGNLGSQLATLLGDPEMAAIVAASPDLARSLRPLCRALGVEPMPPALAIPPTPTPRRRARVTPPRVRRKARPPRIMAMRGRDTGVQVFGGPKSG